MNKFLIGALLVAVATAFTPLTSEAKRLGGGGSSGMQRNMPAKSAPDAVPAKPATPAAAAAPGAAAAPAAAAKRSWMGPIAGLAAGLGIAALMSHLGMGEAMGNFLMMALLAVVAVVAIRFLMKRFGGSGNKPAFAGAGAGAGSMFGGAQSPSNAPGAVLNNNMFRSAEPALGNASASSGSAAFAPAALAPAATQNHVPADFDTEGFERIAKMIFIRMQTANDAADLNDLRNFTTPEMFASVRLELQERGSAAQQTDVVKVDAQVLDVAQEAERQVVSVRFHGLIREEKDGTAADFDEVWHLVKPVDDSRSWAIAGIEQRH